MQTAQLERPKTMVNREQHLEILIRDLRAENEELREELRFCGLVGNDRHYVKAVQETPWNDPARSLHVSPKQRRMLDFMWYHRGQTCTKEAIFNAMYFDADDPPTLKIIDVLVCKLRSKLAGWDIGWKIETIWGGGYRLAEGKQKAQRSVTCSARLYDLLVTSPGKRIDRCAMVKACDREWQTIRELLFPVAARVERNHPDLRIVREHEEVWISGRKVKRIAAVQVLKNG